MLSPLLLLPFFGLLSYSFSSSLPSVSPLKIFYSPVNKHGMPNHSSYCCSRHQALSFIAARPIWPGFMVREGGGPPHTSKESSNSTLTAQKLFWISSHKCLHPIAFPTHYLIRWPPNQEAASGSLRALHLARSVTYSKWKKQAPNGGLQICPSSVELTSVRNMNTGMKRKCE